MAASELRNAPTSFVSPLQAIGLFCWSHFMMRFRASVKAGIILPHRELSHYERYNANCEINTSAVRASWSIWRLGIAPSPTFHRCDGFSSWPGSPPVSTIATDIPAPLLATEVVGRRTEGFQCPWAHSLSPAFSRSLPCKHFWNHCGFTAFVGSFSLGFPK